MDRGSRIDSPPPIAVSATRQSRSSRRSPSTSGPLKMRDRRTLECTPRLGTTGLSCVSTRHTNLGRCLLALQFRKSWIPHLDRRRRASDIRADAHVALRPEVHADVQPDTGTGLTVTRNHRVVVDDVEGAAADAGIRRDEQRRPANGPIQLRRETSDRSPRCRRCATPSLIRRCRRPDSARSR